MATDISLQQETPAAQRTALQPVRVGGWLGGFGNMFRKEMGEWFRFPSWLINSAIWLSIINGMVAFILFVVPIIESGSPGGSSSPSQDPLAMGLNLFFSFVVQAGLIGVIIIAQDEVIGEKQTGTAAWVLSKPVARTAFILAKFAASLLGILLFVVSIPAIVAYFEVSLAAGGAIEVLPFATGLVPVILVLLFYLTLTLMLGTVFDQRGAVLGIAFGLWALMSFAATFYPPLANVLPVNMQDFAFLLGQGKALPEVGMYQMVAAGAWSLLFTVIALWRFQREEF